MNDARERAETSLEETPDPLQKPRVLVICPKYFPMPDGLGHYTTEFCRHLASRFDVAVWTSKERGAVQAASGSEPRGVTVFGTVDRWTWGRPFLSLLDALRFQPTKVLVEFVPFMYTPRGGINFTLVALGLVFAARARLRGTGGLQVMFHELWFPFDWKLKSLVLHSAHRLMVIGLGLAADEIFCSTTRFAGEVRRTLGPIRRPIHVLPVGSALERDESQPREATASGRTLKVAMFGSLHESKNVPLVLRAMHDATRFSPFRLELTVIGPALEELQAALPELAEWLATEVRIEASIGPERAADCLAEQDFFLAYFQDGISSRRTTVMAALCEGVPVVTTFRDVSDSVFLERPFVKLLSTDEATFREELVELLRSSERPFQNVARDDVRRFYRREFSWSSIIGRYAEWSGLRAPAEPALRRESDEGVNSPPSLRRRTS